MKTTSIKLLLVILIFNLSSCKKGETSFNNYLFTDQPQVINCSNDDNKLLNEAIYSFEKDIVAYYNRQENSVSRAYNTFTRQVTSNKMDYTTFVSKHSVELATALQNAGIISNNGLNYEGTVMKCIAENMKEDGIKTTFNALVSTNSMSKNLINPALKNSSNKVARDKYLAMYVVLDYYYAELLRLDASKIEFNRPNTQNKNTPKTQAKINTDNNKVDFNKRPRKQ